MHYNRRIAIAGAAAFGMLFAVTPFAHADGEGVVMGGTGIPTPTAGDVAASNALMNDFGFTGTSQALTTPESAFSYSGDIPPLVNEDALLEKADPGKPIWDFGYSQSADVMSGTEAADLKSDPNLHLFMVGNADNPNGGYLTDNPWIASYYGTVPATPANLDGIPTTDVCIGYDGWCDQPMYQGNWYATSNASDGETYGHLMYYGETPSEMSNAVTTVDGNVTYVDVNNGSLPYLDSYIISSTGVSDGKYGDEVYDQNYAYDKVLVDAGYGHLDTISNGQVISPTGNEFNVGNPDLVTSTSGAEWSSNITQAQMNTLLAQANTLDASNYSQMVNDTPSQMAAWDATGDNPAYNAALQLNSLLEAGVDNGTLTSSQAATDGATMFSGFDVSDPMTSFAASAAAETAPQIAAELAPAAASDAASSTASELPSILASLF